MAALNACRLGGWRRARPPRMPCRARRCAAQLAAPPGALAASPERDLPADLRSPGARVLLLAEGNFSFAQALAERWPSLSVTATSLEAEAEARQLWGAGPALAALSARGARLLHGVDATALEASPRLVGERFARVLFSFPHSGRKGRIQANRELLAGFARSLTASGLLADGGAAEVCLGAGQGGTPADGEALRAPGDSWQLSLQVAEGGLLVAAAEPFDHAGWASRGYTSTGCWRGMGRPQPTREHGFRAVSGVCHTLLPASAGFPAPWPPRFQFDVSIWVGGTTWPVALAHEPAAAQALADEVLHAARRAVGDDALDAASVVNLWQRPEDGRMSLCVRLHYCAPRRALNAAAARVLHDAVRAALPAALPVQLRTRADALRAAVR